MMWMQPSDMWTLVAGLGGVMMLLAGLYLKMLPILMRKRVAVTLWFTSQKVWVVTSPLTWERVFPQLHREAIKDGAIGLDCEWVQVKGSRRPVALLQLATSSGLCVLVRLSHLKGITLLNLEEFLRDDTVLKVGVGTIEDSDYLYQDYKLQTEESEDSSSDSDSDLEDRPTFTATFINLLTYSPQAMRWCVSPIVASVLVSQVT
ncbi:Exonuclease 3'-5' domain-containing protein 2 [Portunus trituberculatus]|uniref:Exonuclease 3'-5' domain-containing protein 2 n=1 Tax=Portunus trituberculatus TaxID=210409 RepID=A0A5B7EJH0_PORTR|nr:Exonuclease 3'-5' domain-containing protein 2 [Portunus trituberculatus]